MRSMLRSILESAGYEVVGEATSGKDALEAYAKLDPDLVLMDIVMPAMDGLNATQALKRYDPRARVVICSAMGQRETVLRAMQAGASDFIIKPFTPGRVLEAVRKALR